MIAAIATAIVSSLLVCIRLHALNFPLAQDATPARQVSVAVVPLVSQRTQHDDWTWCIKRVLPRALFSYLQDLGPCSICGHTGGITT